MRSSPSWCNPSGKGIDYGTGGVGALPHVTMELLRERLGNLPMNHVPYKGSGPAMTDLIAGRLDAMFDATSEQRRLAAAA